jgi:hypothetical protein
MTWNDTTNLPVWVTAGTALSVLGRSANSVGVPAAISGANNQVLGITGSVLGFVSTLPAVSGVNLTALPTGLSTTFTGNNIFNPASGAPIDLRTSAAVPSYAIFRPNSTVRGYVGFPGATNDLITGSAVGDLVLRAESGRLLWSPDGGTTLVNVTPTKGQFTGTLTGMTSATTGTVYYRIENNIVTLYLDLGFLGTSSTTAMTMTGLPAAIQPATTRIGPTLTVDNSANSQSVYSITGGTLTFLNGPTAGGSFTASGAKGLNVGWNISYPLIN